MEAEPQTVAKPRGISNGWKAILVGTILFILVIFVTWFVFYLMSNKSRDDAKNPPSGVTPVMIDLPRYLGKWFEIARLPNTFEDFKDSACSMVTAEYGTIDADTISVKNTCQVRSGAAPTLTSGTTTSNGGLVTTTVTSSSSQDVSIVAGTKISNGHAEVNSNGTLAVTFVPEPIPPFYGNYTVIYRQLGTNADVDPWKTSVVVGGTDNIEYAWILCREPTMSTADFDAAKAALTANGVDVSKLIMTVQETA
jgi:apolipoprotein D and lipocalin family protein